MMNSTQRAVKAVAILKEKYPSAICSLEYSSDPWRLLVMGRLSAQCTDERVNLVSPSLFAAYPNAASMAEADVEKLAALIYSCGLNNTKARDLKGMSRMITDTYGGRVPDNMDDLLKLPGVGRKIANLILGDIYGLPAIVADTHCIRISARIGLCGDGKPLSPEKTERTLAAIIPPDEQAAFCHRIVLFGRDICSAKAPKCTVCPLSRICKNTVITE